MTNAMRFVAITLAIAAAGCDKSPLLAAPPAGPSPTVSSSTSSSSFVDRDGQYQVTFTADDACSALPTALRTRTYTAILNRDQLYTTIALSSADFVPGYETFTGSTVRSAVRLYVSSLYAESRWGDGLPIIERLDSTTYLSFMGVANATVSRTDASIAATWDGTISYCAAAKDPIAPDFPPTCSVALAECTSSVHQLSLTPR